MAVAFVLAMTGCATPPSASGPGPADVPAAPRVGAAAQEARWRAPLQDQDRVLASPRFHLSGRKIAGSPTSQRAHRQSVRAIVRNERRQQERREVRRRQRARAKATATATAGSRSQPRDIPRESGEGTGTGAGNQPDPPSLSVRSGGGLVVGDSIALGAQRCLSRRGYQVDAKVARSQQDGFSFLAGRSPQSIPDNLVIHLGTNGPFDASVFHRAMGHVGDDVRVTWVNIALPERPQYSFERSLNRLIAGLADDYPNAALVDWNGAVASHPEWIASDGIHLNAAGCEGYATAVDAVVRS